MACGGSVGGPFPGDGQLQAQASLSRARGSDGAGPPLSSTPGHVALTATSFSHVDWRGPASQQRRLQELRRGALWAGVELGLSRSELPLTPVSLSVGGTVPSSCHSPAPPAASPAAPKPYSPRGHHGGPGLAVTTVAWDLRSSWWPGTPCPGLGTCWASASDLLPVNSRPGTEEARAQ